MRNKKTNVYDAIILLLIVSSIAFYDIKPLFLMSQFLAVLFSALYVIKDDNRNNKILVKIIVWAVFFILYSSLSTLWSSKDNDTILPTILSIIQAILIAIVLIIYCRHKEEAVNNSLRFIIYSAIILAIRFVATIPVSNWGNGERFSKDTIFGSNAPAIALAYASLLLFWKIIYEKNTKKRRLLYIVAITIFMLIAILMGTKKGLLILLTGSALMLLAKSKKPVKAISTTIFIIAMCIAGYTATQKVTLLYNSIGYRIEDFTNEITSQDDYSKSSTNMRRRLTAEAMQIFYKNPILGIGQDGFRYNNNVYPTYSHCNYTEILANLGLIGFVIYYSLYAVILKNAKDSNYKTLIFPVVITMLIVDIAAVTYSSETQYVLIGTLAGIIGAIKQERK